MEEESMSRLMHFSIDMSQTIQHKQKDGFRSSFKDKRHGDYKVISMKSSFRQISIVEPTPYPTLQELPSQQSILTIQDIDDRLNNLTLDIYAMFALAQEIRNSMLHLNCSLDYFQKYGMRLMFLVACVFEHYGVDRYHFAKLLTVVRYCNSQWKRNLIRTLGLLNSYPSTFSIFTYKVNRNLYLLTMMRSHNTIIEKLLHRMNTRGDLNQKTISYLHHNGAFKFYQFAEGKMMEILNERDEETHLKILLVNQFIRYVLFFIHFSKDGRHRSAIFSTFLVLAQYSCRMMKKFYSVKVIKYIKDGLSTIKRGFQLQLRFMENNTRYKVKSQQIGHLLRIIKQAPLRVIPQLTLNENAFTINLMSKILNNWRKVHLKAQKLRKNTISRSTQQLSINQYIRKQKQNSLKQGIERGKFDEIKAEFRRLNKSRTELHRRKSHSLKPTVNQVSIKNLEEGTAPLSNIKVRKEIESSLGYLFPKGGLHLSRSCSQQSKLHSSKCVSAEKQMKLQDYSQHIQSRVKVIPNLNKIQLYRPDKLNTFYRKEPKLKLQANYSINGGSKKMVSE